MVKVIRINEGGMLTRNDQEICEELNERKTSGGILSGIRSTASQRVNQRVLDTILRERDVKKIQGKLDTSKAIFLWVLRERTEEVCEPPAVFKNRLKLGNSQRAGKQ